MDISKKIITFTVTVFTAAAVVVPVHSAGASAPEIRFYTHGLFSAEQPVLLARSIAQPAAPRYAMFLTITGYSSRPEETDDTPFITASGTTVRDGIVATNLLPFGTKVRLPSLFGDKVFTVEDRMHSRYPDRLDVWFSEYENAKQFGKRYAIVEVVE